MELPTMRTNRITAAIVSQALFWNMLACLWSFLLTDQSKFFYTAFAFLLMWIGSSIANGGREVGEAKILGILKEQEENVDE